MAVCRAQDMGQLLMPKRHFAFGGAIAAALTHGAHEFAANDQTAVDLAVPTIAEAEGFSGVCYTDTTGHETIGYGTKTPITEGEARYILSERAGESESEFAALWPPYTRTTIEARTALLNGVYALGPHGMLEFHDALAAIERNDFDAAAAAFRDSLWFQEEPNRVKQVIGILNGS